jgi:ribosomal protein RSM22 (predicted rRNA methylase)
VAALAGTDRAELGRAARDLSRRYRAEVMDGRHHLDTAMRARAYLATRLPATFAAIRSAFAATAEIRPDFAPATMLDAGAGPGTALWAASAAWPTLAAAVLIEGSSAIRTLGEEFSARLNLDSVTWRGDDLLMTFAGLATSNLVTLAYVLDELPPDERDGLVLRLWDLTDDILLIVEPGTIEGWKRILSARERLIAAGAHVLAPCPHALACPLAPPDWCHFKRRVARSRLHRETKEAEAPWEDESYLYLAVSRKAGIDIAARVIASPRSASGRVNVKLCRRDGGAAWQLVSRRDSEAYKQARRLAWGDAVASTSASASGTKGR